MTTGTTGTTGTTSGADRSATGLGTATLAVVLLVITVLAVVAVATVAQQRPPEVSIEGPDDFTAVVAGAVEQARVELPGLAGCIGDVTVRAAWELPDRAEYRDGAITVRVPATAPRIEELVVHELAHHLDATCPAVDDIRVPFLSAIDTTAPWDAGDTWATTPAEQFAEGVSLVVLDRQRTRTVRVPADAVELLRQWGA